MPSQQNPFHADTHEPIDVTSAEWSRAVAALEQLSLAQLRDLATSLGMAFTGEHAAAATKDDYINILDETEWDAFQREYLRLAGDLRA